METKSSVSAATFVLALILAALVGLFALLFVGLPAQVKADIVSEQHRLETSKRNIEQQRSTVARAVTSDPELFHAPGFDAEWAQQYKQSEALLTQAAGVAAKLDQLSRQNKRSTMTEVDRLLREERQLRSRAEDQTTPVYDAYGKRIAFKRNFPDALQSIESSANKLAGADYAALSQKVEKAENDWPAKRTDLGERLNALVTSQKKATEWQRTAKTLEAKPGDKLTAADYAQALDIQDQLGRAPGPEDADHLSQLSTQVYTEWDKILEDLDRREEAYRAKVKQVVTTVPAPQQDGDTTSTEAWQSLSPGEWQAWSKNVGMTLAHKDYGKYDSEANKTPEPPGFAYMASPEQGRNQYGYWEQRDGGSFWTWLPQYLILRNLLSPRYYQPIPSTDWSRYQQAQRAGTSYYGQDFNTGKPKYGSSGTFTQKSYADSRYVQSGGFAGSKYASGSSGSYAGSRFGSNGQSARPPASPSAGGYFGSRFGSGASPGGQRFGTAGKSAMPSSGSRFGRAPRSAGRSFGRRR